MDPFDETKRMFKEGFMCAKSPFKVGRRLILPNPIVAFEEFSEKLEFLLKFISKVTQICLNY